MINKEKAFDFLIFFLIGYAIYLLLKTLYVLEKHQIELDNLQTVFINDDELENEEIK